MGAVAPRTVNAINYVDNIVQFEVCRQGCCIRQTDTTVPAIGIRGDSCVGVQVPFRVSISSSGRAIPYENTKCAE